MKQSLQWLAMVENTTGNGIQRPQQMFG